MKDLKFENEQNCFSHLKQKVYESFEQFEADIQRFQLGCCKHYSQRNEIKKASKALMGYVKEQIQLIKACKKCYENAHEFGKSSVTMPCSQLHVLIWAKVQGYSGYWPAKIMTVNVDQKTVHVRFFGDYSRSILPAANCYLYSKDHPNKMASKNHHKQKSYLKALQVSFNHENY